MMLIFVVEIMVSSTLSGYYRLWSFDSGATLKTTTYTVNDINQYKIII